MRGGFEILVILVFNTSEINVSEMNECFNRMGESIGWICGV